MKFHLQVNICFAFESFRNNYSPTSSVRQFSFCSVLLNQCQFATWRLFLKKKWLRRNSKIFFLRRTYCLRGQFFTIKTTLSFIYTELKFQFWTKCYFLIIWNKHIGLSCRWGGGFLSNSQVLKTDVAVLTSGCDLRPWPLLDIINTKVLSFPQSSRVGVIYSCQWKKRYAESIEKLC